MKLTYREEAALDVEAILAYWTVIQQQPERADRFLSAFLQAVEQIKQSPTGQLISESADGPSVYRNRLSGFDYAVYYQWTANQIDVLRVLHREVPLR